MGAVDSVGAVAGFVPAVLPAPGTLPTQVVLTKICLMKGEWLKVQSLRQDMPMCESQLCL